MAKTFENSQGQVFSSQQEAAASNAVNSATLAPVPSFELPKMAPATETDNAITFIGESANQGLQNYQALLEQTNKQADDFFSQYLKQSSQGITQSGAEAQALESSGANKYERELNDINSQIMAEQRALTNQLRELDKNPNGLFGGALEQERQKVKDASLYRQADLAVIQMAKQGQFDSARKIADRTVNALMEQQRRKDEAWQFVVQKNWERFSKQEQRILDELSTQKSEERANKEYRLRAEFEQKMKQNDPMYGLELQLKREQVLTERKQRELLGEPTATEKKAAQEALLNAKASVPLMQDKIAAVDLLKAHAGLNSRVGTNVFARGFFGASDKLTGAGQDFAGGIHKLVGGLTLDNLIAAKARGATFGALSDGELRILANSASAITDWEIKDEKGNGTGRWNIDENSFKKELDTIKELTQRAIRQSQGQLFDDDESAALDAVFGGGAVLNAASYYN